MRLLDALGEQGVCRTPGVEVGRGHCWGDDKRWKTQGSCHLELDKLGRGVGGGREVPEGRLSKRRKGVRK